MTEVSEGTLLWEPSAEFKENANITRYMRWLKRVATWLAP
jgi:acetoacetyl-CoA synthetase